MTFGARQTYVMSVCFATEYLVNWDNILTLFIFGICISQCGLSYVAVKNNSQITANIYFCEGWWSSLHSKTQADGAAPIRNVDSHHSRGKVKTASHDRLVSKIPPGSDTGVAHIPLATEIHMNISHFQVTEKLQENFCKKRNGLSYS